MSSKGSDMLANMMGNFEDGSSTGKMPYGDTWWFLNQKKDIENQLSTISGQGLLSSFVLMLTDFGSLLSFSPHAYTGRTMWNLLATDVVNNELPREMDLRRQMIAAIRYHDATDYFDF